MLRILSLNFIFLTFFVGFLNPVHSQETSAVKFTPIAVKVLAAPQAFAGSDNAFHLVYEVMLLNSTSNTWEIKGFKILDPSRPDKPVKKYSDKTLEKRMSLMGSRKPASQLAGDQGTIVWVHLTFPSRAKIPDALVHQLDLKTGDKQVTETGGSTQVNLAKVPVIGAPLKGEKWVAADGCCDSHRHVRALLPVNGGLHTAQRYAIDWEQLGPENKIYSGDKFKVESYQCYGKDVIAVADGKVIQLENKLPNQIPGKLPDQITPQEADGNFVVQKIGPNQYALYAHMMQGSLQVKAGQMLKKGQLIGRVGNSGNTSEPHLHFHLMDGPSALASSGIPYVLDQFDLNGRIKSTEAFDQAAADGTPVKIHLPQFPGFHQKQYPLDQSVVHLHRK